MSCFCLFIYYFYYFYFLVSAKAKRNLSIITRSVYAVEARIYTHDTIYRRYILSCASRFEPQGPLYTVYRYALLTYRYKFFARTSSGMLSTSQWKSQYGIPFHTVPFRALQNDSTYLVL